MNIIKSAILFMLSLSLTIPAVAGKNGKTEKAVIQTTIYCDHCKQCETCGQKFEKELYNIKGLRRYDLDEKAMTITVYYYSHKTSLQEIKTAISRMGYDADELKADPEAYQKLDGCCKK